MCVRYFFHISFYTLIIAFRFLYRSHFVLPIIDASDFDAQYLRHDEPVKASESSSLAGMTLDEIERQTILQALDRHKGNLSQVAMTLGISRAALYRRLEKFNITVNEK